MTFAISGALGVNLTGTDASPQFKPGTCVQLDEQGMAMYVQAGSDLPVYGAVIVSKDGTAIAATTTTAADSKAIGFAQTSIPSAYYGWVQLGGDVIVNLAANCAPSVPLYTTATAGVLDDAVVSDRLCLGIVATRSISNATAVTCVAVGQVIVGSGDMT